jgi:NAD+ diphosphatase
VTASPRLFAFQHPGLDRAEHLREDAEALQRHWPQARVLVLDAEGQALFDGDEDAPRFRMGAEQAAEGPGEAIFLGLDEDGSAWFAMDARSMPEPPAARLDLRNAALRWPAPVASAYAQARALLHWQSRNRFCGACGTATVLGRSGFLARCPACGLEHYPRTDPAIIVAVSDGERLLLGRQAAWPEKRWSVLAGFLEPGESLEQTVAREVMEEAGVRIRSARYLASQPWPFPAALMLGFEAEADPQPVRIGAELEDARWFTADEIRAQVASGDMVASPRMSISRWLIDDWLARH